MKKRAGPEARKALFCADLELDLPSAIRVRVLHPELKYAEFGDDRIESDRYHLPHGGVLERRDLDFEYACVFKVTFGVGKDLSRCVAASHGRGEEPELRPTASDKAELAPLDQ